MKEKAIVKLKEKQTGTDQISDQSLDLRVLKQNKQPSTANASQPINSEIMVLPSESRICLLPTNSPPPLPLPPPPPPSPPSSYLALCLFRPKEGAIKKGIERAVILTKTSSGATISFPWTR